MKLLPKSGDGINDKVISEFVYSAIFNITDEQKKKLPGYLYRQINTDKRAKRFAVNSTTDEKRQLLSFLDIGFFWTFVNLAENTAKEYLAVLKKFRENNPVSALQTMCERGFCVTSDVEYAFLLGQMTQVATTGNYVRNQELLRLGAIPRKWSKRLRQHTESEEMESDANEISKFIGAVWSNVEHVESFTEVTEFDFKILNFLYQRRNQYVPYEKIWDFYKGEIPQRKFPYSINRLRKEHFIQKHIDFSKRDYIITKVGIRTVEKFRDRVLKSFNF